VRRVSDSDPSVREAEETKGKVDLVSVLYIVGGIPAIVAYIVFFFILARFLDFPA
jgi:hypothetical protein